MKQPRNRAWRYMYDKNRIGIMPECELIYLAYNKKPGYILYTCELFNRFGHQLHRLDESYINDMLLEYHILVKTESSS